MDWSSGSTSKRLCTHISMNCQTPAGEPEFVELETRHKCLICYNVIRDAVVTKCRHRMCESCLSKCLQSSSINGPVLCPGNEDFCVALKLEEVEADTGIRREINNLLVICSNEYYGCRQRVPWKDLMEHEITCIFRPIQCPFTKNGCKELCTADTLISHGEQCDFRPACCSRFGEATLQSIKHDEQDNSVKNKCCSSETHNMEYNVIDETDDSCLQSSLNSTSGINIQRVVGMNINVGTVQGFRQVNVTVLHNNDQQTSNRDIRYQSLMTIAFGVFGVAYYNANLFSNACTLFKTDNASKLKNDAFVNTFKEACNNNGLFLPLCAVMVAMLLFFFIPTMLWTMRERHRS